jgi:hypothetical protein
VRGRVAVGGEEKKKWIFRGGKSEKQFYLISPHYNFNFIFL